MRTLDSMSEEKKILKAKETSELHAPIARRLGLHSIGVELDDLCFKTLHPRKPIIEIHTGHYANASNGEELNLELQRIIKASEYAHSLGLQVNAGHGLTMDNTKAIAAINDMVELNIGHSIIARSLFVGLANATSEMKQLLQEARS